MPDTKQPPSQDELHDTHEAARILGLRPNTLDGWRSSGRYPLPFVKCGRRVRYRQSDLEAFMRSRTFTHTGKVK